MINKQRFINGAVFLLLLSIIFLCYSSNLDGPFIFDDSRIQTNPHVQISTLSVENLLRAGLESSPRTRPIAYVTFALNYFVNGLDTTGYHLVNIGIHALAAIFLYLFLQTTLNLPLLRTRYRENTLIPLAAVLIWAAHPLQTQSVTYIIQRMNSMAAMFYILALYLYSRGRLAEGSIKKWSLFSGSVFTGLLALGSKETAVTLPYFIFLYEWYFFQDLDFGWLKRQALPAVILLAAIPLLVLLYLGFNPLKTILAGYAGREFTLSQRLLTELRVVVFYISLLFFPHPSRLNLDHDFAISTGLLSPLSTLFSAIIIFLLFITALVTARRHRLISFCLLWFLGNLVIESSFIGLEIIFEHRVYLPSMLFIFLFVALFSPLLRRSWFKISLICSVVLLFSFWTFARNRIWHDRITLWGDCVEKSPAKARPHNNLGVALKSQGRLAEAVAHFKETIRLDPGFAEAYNNLGTTYMALGRQQEGIANFKMALKIFPNSPQVHVNLGNALVNRWQLEEALFHYKEALRLNPNDREAQMNLSSVQRMIAAKKLRHRKTPR